jgi:hypothetical protein
MRRDTTSERTADSPAFADPFASGGSSPPRSRYIRRVVYLVARERLAHSREARKRDGIPQAAPPRTLLGIL